MLLIYAMLSCSSSEEEKQYSGTELIEMYYDATCQLYVQQDCISEFANCNAPVSSYTDWADCMNYLNSSFSHCGILEVRFEEYQSLVLDCINDLQEAQCNYEDICPEDESILQTGVCGEVLTMLMSNCSPF
jgi:hypothetical protein